MKKLFKIILYITLYPFILLGFFLFWMTRYNDWPKDESGYNFPPEQDKTSRENLDQDKMGS